MKIVVLCLIALAIGLLALPVSPALAISANVTIVGDGSDVDVNVNGSNNGVRVNGSVPFNNFILQSAVPDSEWIARLGPYWNRMDSITSELGMTEDAVAKLISLIGTKADTVAVDSLNVHVDENLGKLSAEQTAQITAIYNQLKKSNNDLSSLATSLESMDKQLQDKHNQLVTQESADYKDSQGKIALLYSQMKLVDEARVSDTNNINGSILSMRNDFYNTIGMAMVVVCLMFAGFVIIVVMLTRKRNA